MNTRAKDLIDMVLLISSNTLNAKLLPTMIEATFKRRASHAFQSKLLAPPDNWNSIYAKLALECEISTDINEGFKTTQDFLAALFSSSILIN